jgi:hypothetical protein
MMQTAKQEPAKDSEADSLPVSYNAKMENFRHQPVPEPHHNCSEKECKGCKPDNSQYHPSGFMSASTAKMTVFIFYFCCFHDFLFLIV